MEPKPTSTFDLQHWHSLDDLQARSMLEPRVMLHYGVYHPLTMEIYADGNIQISTRSGGGHGDPAMSDGKRSFEEWGQLLDEAKRVWEYYYG